MNESLHGKKGYLTLADGSYFSGFRFGADTETTGEVVFNTGMVGYPETLTDPSYRGQILVLTYPIVGNYGIPEDTRDSFDLARAFESDHIHVRALIVSQYSAYFSHVTAVRSLHDWLVTHDVPGLFGVDTRALTHLLREHGVMNGMITTARPKRFGPLRACTPHEVAEVSYLKPQTYSASGERRALRGVSHGGKRVLLVDCGAKNHIVRSLLERGVDVLRVPWNHDWSREEYDGILLSNGPGDPKACTATIEHLRAALTDKKPIFGICLGNQLLSLAAGGDTYKLPYGHRGQNQPCIDLSTQRCYITSQNHGYAVDVHSLGREWHPWFVNGNDGTNEGIRHARKPFFSVQFHPEATPGPTDTTFLFDEFISLL